MRRYLLDSNAAAHCIFRRQGVHDHVRQARRDGSKIGIALPVMAELLAGVENSVSRERNLEIVNRNLSLFRLWPFTAESARIYGRLFAELRRSGRSKSVMDLMIASVALTLGVCTVVTSDSDFSDIPGLRTEDWTS